MIIQVDDHCPLPAAAERAVDAVPHVHPAARETVERSAVPLFDVIVEPVAGRLELFGEFDLGGGQRFRDAGWAIVCCGAAEVIVDFARLRFIDASGIGLLVELRNELAAHGATLRIVHPGAWIGRVFSVCGLDAMLTVPVAR